MEGITDKHRIRRDVEAMRRGLVPSALAEASAAVCAHVLALPLFRDATRLVGYSATHGEIDPGVVVTAARRCGRLVYYPRVTEPDLGFFRAELDDLRIGSRGMREPTGDEELPAVADGTVVLVPGVAFDGGGRRLGRGGGHYDRALPRLRGATFVGLAHDFQLLPRVPEGPRDVRVHAVVTPGRVIVCTTAEEIRP